MLHDKLLKLENNFIVVIKEYDRLHCKFVGIIAGLICLSSVREGWHWECFWRAAHISKLMCIPTIYYLLTTGMISMSEAKSQEFLAQNSQFHNYGPQAYLVFFDSDKSELTLRARQVIANSVATARRLLGEGAAQRVVISGHTDAGTPVAERTRQSQLRANTVLEELVALGVPRGRISVEWFGADRPLVPATDGVEEPQNRRVEIVIR